MRVCVCVCVCVAIRRTADAIYAGNAGNGVLVLIRGQREGEGQMGEKRGGRDGKGETDIFGVRDAGGVLAERQL